MTQTPKKKKYNVTFKFNGELHTKRTEDLNKAIDEVRPPILHTEMYVLIKIGKELIERKLNLIQARRIFQDALHREVFINNLHLQHYV